MFAFKRKVIHPFLTAVYDTVRNNILFPLISLIQKLLNSKLHHLFLWQQLFGHLWSIDFTESQIIREYDMDTTNT
jgi:hypothetical protein